MLLQLDIQNFAIIEKVSLEPGPGLLIMTGETGAGKSILVDAISCLAGERVSKDVIRYGAETALIEAVFQLDLLSVPTQVRSTLANFTADEEDCQEIILSREISRTGRSVSRINGRITTLTDLKQITGHLFDIHGQYDQQAIFQTSSHILLLDRYGGAQIKQAKQAYKKILERYNLCQKELAVLGSDPGARARQIDLLTYQIEEICAVDPQANEDTTLTERQRLLANIEKIKAALAESYERLAGDEPGSVLSETGSILSLLGAVSDHLTEVGTIETTLLELQDAFQTTAMDIRSLFDRLDFDPEELDRINRRLDQLYRLKKKYGGSIDQVLDFLARAEDELANLAGGEERFAALQREQDKICAELLAAGAILNDKRRQAGTQMEQAIGAELKDLGMKSVQFFVSIEQQAEGRNFRDNGLDLVEFVWSVNPGEPVKPLAQIASGGEAARIMLAIKTILADADPLSVLIFDEIDTGISGETAGKVGQKLLQLATGRQVFCITHMAQIASLADDHYLISKESSAGRTKTNLARLQDGQKTGELARLLSGGIADEAARNLADQLLEQAKSLKKTLRPE